jgi:hypothetical protein
MASRAIGPCLDSEPSNSGPVGCGCLSLRRCALSDAGDTASEEGTGSRWLREARSRGARS